MKQNRKKIVSKVTAAACSLTFCVSAFSGASFAASQTVKRGDMNIDGTIDILDVVSLRAGIVGNIEFTADQEVIGDVNDDDVIDVLDVVQLRNVIVNKTELGTITIGDPDPNPDPNPNPNPDPNPDPDADNITVLEFEDAKSFSEDDGNKIVLGDSCEFEGYSGTGYVFMQSGYAQVKFNVTTAGKYKVTIYSNADSDKENYLFDDTETIDGTKLNTTAGTQWSTQSVEITFGVGQHKVGISSDWGYTAFDKMVIESLDGNYKVTLVPGTSGGNSDDDSDPDSDPDNEVYDIVILGDKDNEVSGGSHSDNSSITITPNSSDAKFNEKNTLKIDYNIDNTDDYGGYAGYKVKADSTVTIDEDATGLGFWYMTPSGTTGTIALCLQGSVSKKIVQLDTTDGEWKYYYSKFTVRGSSMADIEIYFNGSEGGKVTTPGAGTIYFAEIAVTNMSTRELPDDSDEMDSITLADLTDEYKPDNSGFVLRFNSTDNPELFVASNWATGYQFSFKFNIPEIEDDYEYYGTNIELYAKIGDGWVYTTDSTAQTYLNADTDGSVTLSFDTTDEIKEVAVFIYNVWGTPNGDDTGIDINSVVDGKVMNYTYSIEAV